MGKLKIMAGLLCFVFATHAHAQGRGSDAGNGGGAIVLPNGDVILADPYIVQTGQPVFFEQFHSELKDEITRAGRLLVNFGATEDARFGAKFIAESVAHPLTEYQFMAILPERCRVEAQEDGYHLPDGLSVTAVACTAGYVTYINDGLFRRMTVREQAKLVIHERLHAYALGAPHEHIADLTSTIDEILSISRRQLLGERFELSDAQIESLRRVTRRIAQLGLNRGRTDDVLLILSNYQVMRNGGGLIGNGITTHPTAFVSLDSKLDGPGFLSEKSTVIGSRQAPLASVGAPSRIELGPQAYLANTNIDGTLKMGDSARIENTGLYGNTELGAGAHLVRVRVCTGTAFRFYPDLFKVMSGAHVSDTEACGTITVGSGAQVSAQSFLRGPRYQGIWGWTSERAARKPMLVIGARAQVERSHIEGLFTIWAGIAVRRSTLKAPAFDGDYPARFTAPNTIKSDVLDSELGGGHVRVNQGVALRNSQLHFDNIQIGTAASVINTQWNGDDSTTLGVSLVIESGAVLHDLGESRFEGSSCNIFYCTKPSLTIERNARIFGDGRPVCRQGKRVVFTGGLEVSNLEELRDECDE